MQDINLLHYLPKRKNTYLTLRRFILANAICWVILCIMQLGMLWHVQHQQHTLEMVKGKLTPSTIANTSIPQWTHCEWKMSQFFAALSNTIQSGVWLTEIDASLDGKDLLLKGHALSNNTLQTFLMGLNQDPLFGNQHFNLQDVTQTVANSGISPGTFDFALHRQVNG